MLMKRIPLTYNNGDLNTAYGEHNDIALIKTTHRVHMTDYVKPIPLITGNIIRPGAECTVLGWGQTHFNSSMYMHNYYMESNTRKGNFSQENEYIHKYY